MKSIVFCLTTTYNKVQKKWIPFDASVDPFHLESSMRYLGQFAHDISQGQAHFTEHDLMEMENSTIRYTGGRKD